jgi:hypothetical protein
MQTALWVGNMIPLSFPATKTTYVWFRRSMSHLFFSSRAMRFGGAIPLRAGAMISEMSGYVCLFSSISERERDHSDVFSSMSGRVCCEVVGEDWRVLAASSTAYNSGNDG